MSYEAEDLEAGLADLLTQNINTIIVMYIYIIASIGTVKNAVCSLHTSKNLTKC
jgi:hypothetical protein